MRHGMASLTVVRQRALIHIEQTDLIIILAACGMISLAGSLLWSNSINSMLLWQLKALYYFSGKTLLNVAPFLFSGHRKAIVSVYEYLSESL